MFRHASWLLMLALCQPLGARYRLGDAPLFLGETVKGQFRLEGQHKSFTISADTTRQESVVRLSYGVTDKLGFEFSYPFLGEVQGPFSKSGQGDLLAALSYNHPLDKLPGVRLGLRQALVFPSGFRQELTGFDSFTAGRTQSETLVQLEYGDKAEEPSALWLSLNGGLRTDNHLEGTRLLWGASFRYHLWKQRLFVESELAQEMETSDKEAQYQFSAGMGARLPFGFSLRAGADERVLYNLDRFGVYAGLAWTHRPPQVVRLERRHLRDFLQKQLDLKNKVPAFTLEPGTPELLTDKGRLPFLPLRVAVLPLAESKGAPVAQTLGAELVRGIEADSTFQVVPADEVELALLTRRHTPGTPLEKPAIDELGRQLKADLVIQGRVLDYEPSGRSGVDLAPLLVGARSFSLLEARLWLHQVDQAGSPVQVEMVERAQGRRRWSFATARHGLREQPGNPLERSALSRQVITAWSQRACLDLMYEVTEQVVVKK